MNAVEDPMRLAATSPHHAPGRPISSVIDRNQANGSVKMMLLKIVTISAFIPCPVP